MKNGPMNLCQEEGVIDAYILLRYQGEDLDPGYCEGPAMSC